MSARTAARLVARGRRRAESLMVDECIITRPTGATDNSDGTVTKTDEIVYSGKCRVQTYDPYERRPQVADTQLNLRRDVIQLPIVGSEDVTTGCLVEITAATLDDSLIGRQWRIAGPARKTHATARRMYMEEPT